MKSNFCTLEVTQKPSNKFTAVISPSCDRYMNMIVSVIVIPEANSNLIGRSFDIFGNNTSECCDSVLEALSPYPLSEIIVDDTGFGLAFLEYLASKTNGFVTVRSVTNLPSVKVN